MSPLMRNRLLALGLGLAGLTLAVGAPYAPADGADGVARPGAPVAHAARVGARVDAQEVPDTLAVGDRRCLSRRAEDCLTEPVPTDEPHGAVCAVCHEMWSKDRTPIQSARACSGGECHADPAGLAPFHRTVDDDVLDQCLACHAPHGFRVGGGGDDCRVCHTAGGSPVTWAGAEASRSLPAELDFAHPDHATVACVTCHGADARHGTVVVADRRDCRSCHHTRPQVDDCTGCHRVDEVRATSFTVTKPFEIRIGSLDRPLRTVVFDHANHWRTECAVCHTGGIDLETAQGADCSGCHLEHHEPTADCTGCHETPAAGAHDRNAHFGCGGAGCHDPVPEGIRSAPRTRPLCLSCHTDLADHMPGEKCVDCHVLPPATP